MRVLLTGANGQLGAYVHDALVAQGDEVIAWRGHREVDLTDRAALTRAFERERPEAVIHAAAIAKPAQVFNDPDRVRVINVDATRRLADLAAMTEAKLIFLSTDMVFDGESDVPYRESHPPCPVSEYGHQKVEAEASVLRGDLNMVVRVSLMFGPARHGSPTLFDQQIAAMRKGEPVRLFEDEWRTPLALPEAAGGLVMACHSKATGLYHLGGVERLSRWEMGWIMAQELGADSQCLSACSRLSMHSAEPRPRDLSLDTMRWERDLPTMPRRTFREHVRRMVLHTSPSGSGRPQAG
ncbi:MAG: sugar nucleotide-binding protein [Planctomycetes bacterium]|nr:sugar nucleotide-binding protein [Planctomycetota bacterium]